MTKEIKIPNGIELNNGEYAIKLGFANLFHRPGIADGGQLLLTNERLIFLAHAVNINSNLLLSIDLKDIIDLRIATNLLINQIIAVKDNLQKETKFVVYKGKNWIKLINEEIEKY